MSDPITPLGGKAVFDGKTFSVRVERFAHDDGEEVEREVVRRQDAAAIVAYDEQNVWLVRQPREAILQHTLELPAGKLDVEGESPLQTAQRELGEEIGKSAQHWQPVISYFSSSGYSDEEVHISAATGLRDVDADSDPGERIEIVPWPLADLDAAIEACQDAKTVIGLQWLAAAGRTP